jgi:hypothetical protein
MTTKIETAVKKSRRIRVRVRVRVRVGVRARSEKKRRGEDAINLVLKK